MCAVWCVQCGVCSVVCAVWCAVPYLRMACASVVSSCSAWSAAAGCSARCRRQERARPASRATAHCTPRDDRPNAASSIGAIWHDVRYITHLLLDHISIRFLKFYKSLNGSIIVSRKKTLLTYYAGDTITTAQTQVHKTAIRHDRGEIKAQDLSALLAPGIESATSKLRVVIKHLYIQKN